MAIVVWALHFAVIYGTTGLACARGAPGMVPWVIGIATLLAAAACSAIFVMHARRRGAFRHWLSAGIAAMALLAIVWEALPVLLVPACA